jgi:CoA-transferase family III
MMRVLALGNDAQFRALCDRVIARPALAADARFQRNRERVHNREILVPTIEQIFHCERSHNTSPGRVIWEREYSQPWEHQMRKMLWFVILAALILAGVAGWATRLEGARSDQVVAPAGTTQIDPLRDMSTAKELPSRRHDLY